MLLRWSYAAVVLLPHTCQIWSEWMDRIANMYQMQCAFRQYWKALKNCGDIVTSDGWGMCTFLSFVLLCKLVFCGPKVKSLHSFWSISLLVIFIYPSSCTFCVAKKLWYWTLHENLSTKFLYINTFCHFWPPLVTLILVEGHEVSR